MAEVTSAPNNLEDDGDLAQSSTPAGSSHNLRLLAGAMLISGLGSQASVVANALQIKDLTSSGLWLGLTLGLSALIWGLFSPVAGLLVDRFARKPTLVTVDLACALVMGALTASIAWNIAPAFRVAFILTATSLVSIASTIALPASQALLKDIVPSDSLTRGTGVLQSVGSFASVVGRALGGAAYAVIGPIALYGIDAFSYLLSALLASRLQLSKPRADQAAATVRHAAASSSSMIQGVAQGFRVVRQVPGMLSVFLLVGCLNLFNAAIFPLLPFYTEGLGLSLSWYGIFMGATAGGRFVGNLLAFRGPGKRLSTASAMAGLLTLAALFRLLTAMSTNGLLSALTLGLESACYGCFDVHTYAKIQKSVASQSLGRVLGLMHAFVIPLAPLGMSLAGIILDHGHLRPNTAVAVSGWGLLLVSVLCFTLVGFREFFGHAKPREHL